MALLTQPSEEEEKNQEVEQDIAAVPNMVDGSGFFYRPMKTITQEQKKKILLKQEIPLRPCMTTAVGREVLFFPLFSPPCEDEDEEKEEEEGMDHGGQETNFFPFPPRKRKGKEQTKLGPEDALKRPFVYLGGSTKMSKKENETRSNFRFLPSLAPLIAVDRSSDFSCLIPIAPPLWGVVVPAKETAEL